MDRGRRRRGWVVAEQRAMLKKRSEGTDERCQMEVEMSYVIVELFNDFTVTVKQVSRITYVNRQQEFLDEDQKEESHNRVVVVTRLRVYLNNVEYSLR